MKPLVRLASKLFPKQVMAHAYQQLTNPQVRKLRPHELAVLEKAKKETFAFRGFDIPLYTWRGSDKTVMLIHGWEGQAGNFSDIIEAFLKQGYTLYAFDAPAHGFSSNGQASLFDFTDLVGILLKKFGAKQLISHSFGGVATTYALYTNPNIEIDKYLLLTTPDKFTDRINDVASTVGITEKVKQLLIQRLERETDQDINLLNVSEFVKSIKVKKALIVHDKNDRVEPIHRSRHVYENWPACDFKEVEGTGHFRILRTPQVIDMALNFFED